MLKPRHALFLLATAGEHSTPGGGDTPSVDAAAAIAAIEDKTLPMSQRLGVALKALQGIAPAAQFTAVQADLATAQTALVTRTAELATAQASLTALQTDFTALEGEKTTLAKEHATLCAQERDVEKRAAAKSAEHIAALGFPAGKLPASSADLPAEIPANRAELEAAMGKLQTADERRALLKKFNNRAA